MWPHSRGCSSDIGCSCSGICAAESLRGRRGTDFAAHLAQGHRGRPCSPVSGPKLGDIQDLAVRARAQSLLRSVRARSCTQPARLHARRSSARGCERRHLGAPVRPRTIRRSSRARHRLLADRAARRCDTVGARSRAHGHRRDHRDAVEETVTARKVYALSRLRAAFATVNVAPDECDVLEPRPVLPTLAAANQA